MAEERFELEPLNDALGIAMIAWPAVIALGLLTVSIENLHVSRWPVLLAVIACIAAAWFVWKARARGRTHQLVIEGDTVTLHAGRDTWTAPRAALQSAAGHVMVTFRYGSFSYPAVRFSVGARTLVVQTTDGAPGRGRGARLRGQRFTAAGGALEALQKALRLRE